VSDQQLPFRADENALMQFGSPGSAPLLNYNVPQPAEYNGRYFLDLALPTDCLKPPRLSEPGPKPDNPPDSGEKPPGGSKPGGSKGQFPGADYSIDAINDLVTELVSKVDLNDLLDFGQPPTTGPLPGPPDPGPIPGPPGEPLPVPPFDLLVDAALPKLIELRPGAGVDVAGLLADGVIRKRLKELGVDSDQLISGIRPNARPKTKNARLSLVPGERPAYLRRLDALLGRLGVLRFAQRVRRGERLVQTRGLDGAVHYELREAPPVGPPRIAIVHLCRMSSYLGEYGAGRTISTFSLLPGERHEIEVKTYKRSKTKQTEASSILDSFEEETADEFQSDLTQESSTAQSQDSSVAIAATAQASATWGWGSANASGSVNSTAASKREDFAKNVSSATQKHAAKAAAKRQLEVNTTSESETEEGEERAIKRSIENINVGRTLNFILRQMNQVFVTVLAVTDIRLGYTNGQPGHYQEFTLPEMAQLLDQFVVPAKISQVKAAIWNALYLSFDFQSTLTPLIEAMDLSYEESEGLISNARITASEQPMKASYWRFPKVSTLLSRNDHGIEVKIPGVVLGVTRSVLPTDGVIVEALLGQGNALDAYSMGLQMEAVREKLAANDRTQTETDLKKLKHEIIANNDKERAELMKALNPQQSSDG
jgi:hypothetical protein